MQSDVKEAKRTIKIRLTMDSERFAVDAINTASTEKLNEAF